MTVTNSSIDLPIAAVVLAAGGSRRMGRCKQLLPIDGVSLVRRATKAALDAGCAPVVVVVGSDADSVERQLDGLAVWVVQNRGWEAGMGSSIHAGLGAISDEPLAGVVMMLCDQPAVDAVVIRRLIEGWRASEKPIAAAGYGSSAGAPAVFAASTFAQLMAIDPAAGAKQLLNARPDDVVVIPAPEAAGDVDTLGDYEALSGW